MIENAHVAILALLAQRIGGYTRSLPCIKALTPKSIGALPIRTHTSIAGPRCAVKRDESYEMSKGNTYEAETSQMAIHSIYLGLGSNLGDRDTNLRAAIDKLGEYVEVKRVSSV